jgi:hypothetical protein
VVSLVWAAGARGQPRPEQWNAGYADGNVNVALLAPSKAGDLIVVAASGLAMSCNVLDNAGNTYVPIGTPVSGVSGFSYNQQLFYAQNIVALPQPLQLSVQCPGGELRAFEYSGVARSNALDQSAGATGADSFVDSGFVTPTAPGELVVGAVLSQNLAAGPGSGFTDEYDFHGDLVEDGIDALQAPIAATASSNAAWIASVATFFADSTLDAGPPIDLFTDGGVGGPFTALQWNGVQTSTGAATFPLLAPPHAGSVIVVCLTSTDFDAGVVDDQSNAYVLGSFVAGIGALAGTEIKLFYAVNTGTSSTAISSTGSGVTSMQAVEYLGIDTVTPFDSARGARSSTGSTTLSGPLSTATDDELVVACGVTSGMLTGPGPALSVRQLMTGTLIADGFAPDAGNLTVSLASNDPSWILLAGAFHALGFDGGAVLPDGGSPDAGGPDSGMAGAGAVDAGTQDGGVPDGGPSGPRLMNVSCGCESSPFGGFVLLAAMLTCRRAWSRRR